jgi:SAM-dependent methyltransferase
MTFLAERCRQPEIMDEPNLDPPAHRQALRGMERFNFFSGSSRILWKPLRELLRQREGPVRVLDIATGAGDVCVALHRRARRAGLNLIVHGCDVSPTAVAYAQERAARRQADVHFFTHDVVQGDLPSGYDALVSSLFLHHLDNEQAVDLLARMGRAAGALVLINDLRRARGGYFLAWLATRVLSRSHITHVDGPRSVEGAFTVAEAAALAERAGLRGATVTRYWPYRYLLAWKRGTGP